MHPILFDSFNTPDTSARHNGHDPADRATAVDSEALWPKLMWNQVYFYFTIFWLVYPFFLECNSRGD